MGCLHDSLSTIAHGSLHHYVSYISAPYTCPWSISHIFWVMSAAKNNVTSNHTSILTLMDNTILSTKVANSDVWSRDFSVMYSIGYVWIWNLQFKFWMPACFLLGQIHFGPQLLPFSGLWPFADSVTCFWGFLLGWVHFEQSFFPFSRLRLLVKTSSFAFEGV